MTLEDIYYIGQTIAVVAILGSLGAIWVQLRKDHALAKAEHQREILTAITQVTNFVATDADALDSVRACCEDYVNATARQQAQFFYVVHTHINIAEKALYMGRDQLINTASFEGMKGAALAYLVTPGGKQLWSELKDAVGADIRDELDRSLHDDLQITEVGDFYRALRRGPSRPAAVGNNGGVSA